jgi:hypothetical protein
METAKLEFLRGALNLLILEALVFAHCLVSCFIKPNYRYQHLMEEIPLICAVICAVLVKVIIALPIGSIITKRSKKSLASGYVFVEILRMSGTGHLIP